MTTKRGMKMSTLMNANDLTYERMELFGNPVIYTLCRIDRSTIPAGMFAYDLRDCCDGIPNSVEPRVICNHFGTIITKEPIEFDGGLDGTDCFKQIGSDDYNFLGEDITLDEYAKGDG